MKGTLHRPSVLKSLRWGQEDLGKEYLRMQKGNEHIYIFRYLRRISEAGTIFWSESESIKSKATLIADYESDFTDDQLQKAMDALLECNLEIKTILIFEKYFRTPKQLNEPVEIEKPINEPVLFYRCLDDGELQTFALRIIRSQESSYLVSYNLLTVESRQGSSSSSEDGGKVKPGGIWVADTSINALTDESKSIQLQVKSLGNEHFLFAITP